MAKIFITGSSDGLGLLSAQALSNRGHEVYLHARNAQRAKDARAACPGAKDVFVADLSSADETKALATQLNGAGPWDAILHNAGVMGGAGQMGRRRDGVSAQFAINTLAPYLLTCLVDPPPARYLFLSSSMHQGGDASLRDVVHCGYSDSKLHNVMLSLYFARRLANRRVQCHSMDPGWVPTKMGGYGAPDDINKAVDTYVMLAEGAGAAEGKTGAYWYQSRTRSYKAAARDVKTQEKLVEILEAHSGVSPPTSKVE